MNAESATRGLEVAGYVVDIGQIENDAKAMMAREVRAGRLLKIRAPYAGIMMLKTHYVSDVVRFDLAQAASGARLRLAVAMDEAKRRQSGKARIGTRVIADGSIAPTAQENAS